VDERPMNSEQPDPVEPSPGPDGRGPWPGRRDEIEEISLLDLASVFLRHRRTVLGWTAALCVGVVAFAFVQARSYSAEASFMPQADGGAASSRLSSLAGQFGIDVPTGQEGQSPQFYADLLTSREILSKVAADTFEVADTAGIFARGILRGPLADLLEIAEDEPAPARRVAVIEWLRERAVSTSTGTETGVVELEVTTPWPDLSGAIAARLLDLVNEFNLETRQSQAAAERAFIEERMAEARQELRRAEDELERFLRNNRQFQNSPELVFQHDRLQRQVAMRQQVYTSLSESYEQARINEVRNTPVITVVEAPEAPVRPDPRRLPLKGALGLVLGGMVGAFAAFGKEFVRRQREEEAEEYLEFHELWEETVGDLRRPLRRFRGRKSAGATGGD